MLARIFYVRLVGDFCDTPPSSIGVCSYSRERRIHHELRWLHLPTEDRPPNGIAHSQKTSYYFITIAMLRGEMNAEWGGDSRRKSASDLSSSMKKTRSVDFSRMSIRTSRTGASEAASQFSLGAARGFYKE